MAWQKATWGETGVFCFIDYILLWRHSCAETQFRNLKTTTEAETMESYCVLVLSSRIPLVSFLIPQSYLSTDVSPLSGMDSSTSIINQTNSPTSLPKGYSDKANVSVSLSNCRCLYWVDKNLIWTGQKHDILHTMHVDILKKMDLADLDLGHYLHPPESFWFGKHGSL